MLTHLLDPGANQLCPLYLLTPKLLQSWLPQIAEPMATSITANRFTAKKGQSLAIFTPNGQKLVLAGLGSQPTTADIGTLPDVLGEERYCLHFAPGDLDRTGLALGWLLGCYRYERFQRNKSKLPFLLVAGADTKTALAQAEAICLARDLINTPANELGPVALEQAIRDLAKPFAAKITSVVGDELLQQNYPMIHAVGRAAEQPPRLVHLVWGEDTDPAISLVGKGVIFDTGGLNIKTGAYMKLMKKDMGGAANALALAHLIMQAGLPVYLNVWIPIVDNAIAGNAYRPSDILPSRAGMSVEVDNTDAEGRLILADALSRAIEDEPELLIDFATLTGAARTALGPELAPFYTASDQWADRLLAAAKTAGDPVWQMPLWPGYDSLLDSDIADICHTASSSMAGSVTAALFLQRFVGDTAWIHFDIYGWSLKQRPGQPIGGAAQGPLAVFTMLRDVYGK
ncbi:Peptidase B [hydrothermal vent metagenome]|uniref:Peptidase B n=1 Tax=hydrothermal vent metagenome TaxID=652676 RepID=A0A3B0RQ87_9ZZZZ